MLTKSFEIKRDAVNLEARTFEGYAATWTLDNVNDIIHKGAFTKSIQEAFPANKIKVLWQHQDPIGLPIEMREDDFGLWVKGKVSHTQLGNDALQLMMDGVIDKMSIGFIIPQGKSDLDADGVRHIREVKLMEFSPVTFPANEAAVITAVKSIELALKEGVQFEHKSEIKQTLETLFKSCSEPQCSTHKDEPSTVDTQTIETLAKSLGELQKLLQIK